MIVSFKKLLNTWSLQFGLVCNHCFWIGIFPFTIGVFCIEVIFSKRRDERSFHSLFLESIPIETFEPVMLLDEVWAVFAESATWLSLNKFVDEVSSLWAPATGNILHMNLLLLMEDMLSDLFSVLSLVGSFTEHALISDNAHGEIVNGHSVILSAHDLWRHIARSSWCIFWIFRLPQSCNSKICDS